MDTTARYSAFISYSHTDTKWAEWLQRAIETYRLPVSLRRSTGLPKKLKKVFRDRDELATGQNLGEHLQAALDSADTLIAVCSPASRGSAWVNQEIDYFKSLGKGHRIFCLLVEGDDQSLAPSLLQDIDGNPLEPLAADPRETADGKTRAKLKIIASMLDLNLDDLARREAIRRRQRMSFVLAGVAAVLAVTIWGVINQQANQAQIEVNLTSAMTTADYIDSRRENLDMTSLGFASDLLQSFMNNIGELDTLDGEQAAAVAKLKRTHGLALYDLGETDLSIEKLKTSRNMLHELFDYEPNNVDLGTEAAIADYYLASIYLYERKFDAARAPLLNYSALIEQLYLREPGDEVLSSEAVLAPAAVLKLMIESKAPKADIHDAISRAVKASNRGLQANTNDTELLVSRAMLSDDIANFRMMDCNVLESAAERQNTIKNLKLGIERNRDNRSFKTHLSNALPASADVHAATEDAKQALDEYLEGQQGIRELLSSDPSNRYLEEKIFLLDLDLVSLLSYYPALLSSRPDLKSVLIASGSLDYGEKATEYGKEALLTLRRAHYALSIEDWAEAEQQSRILGEMTAEDMTGKGREYYRVFYLLQQRLLSAKLGTSQNSIDIPMDDEAAQEIMTDQSCPARFYQWATHVLNDDSNAANSVAAEAWNLGLKGQELAFYARLFDIEHPPAGTIH